MTRNYLNYDYNASLLYVQQMTTHCKNLLSLSYCKICKKFTILLSIPEIKKKKKKDQGSYGTETPRTRVCCSATKIRNVVEECPQVKGSTALLVQ